MDEMILSRVWMRSCRVWVRSIAECGWDLAESWMRFSRVWMRSIAECGWDLAESWTWDLAECGWDLAESWTWDLAECGWNLAESWIWDLAECGWNLAEWLQRLTANAKVAAVLGSIPASSDNSGIWEAAEEAVLNKVHEKNQKIPLFKKGRGVVSAPACF